MRPLAAALLPLLLVLGLTACGDAEGPREAKIEDFRFLREADGTQVVRGEVYNPSTRAIRNVEIEVALYEEGADVSQPTETMRVRVQNIAPGERVPFRHEVDSGRTLTGARVQGLLLR